MEPGFKGMAGRKGSGGYTFLEVMVVVIIAGVLAILCVNPMKNYLRRIEFRNSAQNIKRLIQTAQSRAMADPNTHVGVFFRTSGSAQQAFLFLDRQDPSEYTYDGKGDPFYLQAETLKRGCAFETIRGYPPEIVFRGDGSAWKSFKIVITDGILRDTLDVLASTGRVRLAK